MTKTELQQLVDQCGSIDEAARLAAIPRVQFRARCQRLGIRANRRSAQAPEAPAQAQLGRVSAYLERMDYYADRLEELFMNTGFSGEMLELGDELDLDVRHSFRLAERAAELAELEFDDLCDRFWSLFCELQDGHSPRETESGEDG